MELAVPDKGVAGTGGDELFELVELVGDCGRIFRPAQLALDVLVDYSPLVAIVSEAKCDLTPCPDSGLSCWPRHSPCLHCVERWAAVSMASFAVLLTIVKKGTPLSEKEVMVWDGEKVSE